MRIWLLSALLLALGLLVGCGGSGREQGGTSNSQVPEEFFQAFRTALQTRNVDAISANVSRDYLNNCVTRDQFVAEIQSTLGSAGQVELMVDPITNKNVNDLTGRATFTGGWTLRVSQGEATREMSRSGNMVLFSENGKWKLFGNQACN